MPSHTLKEKLKKAKKAGRSKSFLERIRAAIAKSAPGGALIESSKDKVKKATKK